MSSKRRNRSRWDSSRSPVVSPSPLPSAAPASVSAPPTAVAAAGSPAPPQGRIPDAAMPLPVSDFSMDYRYELSLPAQMLINRLERQPSVDPRTEHSNPYLSRDSTGYRRQASYYGSSPGDVPSQFEDYPSGLPSSEVSQHHPLSLRNDRSQLSAQFVSGVASEAPPYFDPMRERWNVAGYGGQNPSAYGLSSGLVDVGHHPLQLARMADFSSERGLGGRGFVGTLTERQVGSALLTAGRENASNELKGRDSMDKVPIGLQDPDLYCRSRDRPFSTVHEKEEHLEAHRKFNEENIQAEAAARVVKDHILDEQKHQIQGSLRTSDGSQKEADEIQASESQKDNEESSDGKRTNEMPEPRERHKGGLSTPSQMYPQEGRGELPPKKARDYKNFRAPGRYNPY